MVESVQAIPVLRQRLDVDLANTRETMRVFSQEYALLERLHILYDGLGGAVGRLDREEQMVAMHLYQVAGDALVSACLHALKCKGQESLLFLRKAAEATAFAARVAQDRFMAILWIQRNTRVREFRKHFSSDKLFDAKGLVSELRELYKLCSDAGVHANLESLVGRRDVLETEERTRLRYAVYDIEPAWVNRYLLYSAQAIRDIYAAFARILAGCFKDEKEPERVLAEMDAALAPCREAFGSKWREELES